jgi:hypothetical protein
MAIRVRNVWLIFIPILLLIAFVLFLSFIGSQGFFQGTNSREFPSPEQREYLGDWVDPELGPLQFDIVIDGRWRIPSTEGGQIVVVPPFDLTVEPAGILEDHADDWIVEVGRSEAVWGQSISFSSDMRFHRPFRLVKRSGGTVISFGLPLLCAIGPEGQSESYGSSALTVIKRSSDQDAVEGNDGPGPDFRIELSKWSAFEGADGTRTGFDASFTITHDSMYPSCNIGVRCDDLSAFSFVSTYGLGRYHAHGDTSPPLSECPPFDGPGNVTLKGERQWWAEWTRGEHVTTLDLAMRILPETQELLLMRSMQSAEMELGWKDISSLGRERPTVGIEVFFDVNCGADCFSLQADFAVPLTGIENLERPPAGSDFVRVE